jgi:hemoglobin/transferrin/lactoferrin receptor protein
MRRSILFACLLAAVAAAADEPEKADEEIVIEGARTRTLDIELEPTVSANRIDLEGLSRAQAVDAFDAVRDMPGVTIEGGPRTSGKSFSIRGFSNNEDVLIQIDGVTQNFEKYRYGSGVDIDPELLKSIAVYRGGAATTQGSGYIGGVVAMETKDASDFLADQARVGAQGKVGYLTNNDGALYSLTGYGRPTGFSDTLFNVTKRHTNEYQLPDGTRFQDSAEAQLSGLGKVVFHRDDLRLSSTQRHAEDSGLEPFDITGGVTGIGGNVRRDTREQSTSLRLQWDPASPLVALDGTLGFIDKSVTDAGSAIAGIDAEGHPIGTDFFDYQIWTLNLQDSLEFDLLGTAQRTRFGVQGNRERRSALRLNPNVAPVAMPNPAQPSGEKQTYAVFAEHSLAFHGLGVQAGVRRDWYRVAPGHDTGAILAARGLDEAIDFARTSPSYAFTYALAPVELFYRWSRTFRAPLLDEYFARGSFSSCFDFTLFERPPVPPQLVLPVAPVAPNLADFGGDILAYLAALAQYTGVDLPNYLAELNAALTDFNQGIAVYEAALQGFPTNPTSQANALCGEFYEPEQAVTREAGIAFGMRDLVTPKDALDAKLTYYDIRVENLLESIHESASTHRISQPGREVRKGFEFELHYLTERWFADFALTTLGGYYQYNFFADNVDPDVARFGDPGTTPLFNQPGDNLSFTLGVRPLWNIEFGHRLRAFSARSVTVGIQPNCAGGLFTNPVCNILGTQSGSITSNFFAAWQPHRRVDLRLTVDNALNKEYELSGFGGALGATAPGRDVRLSLSVTY